MKPLICLGSETIKELQSNTLVVITNSDGCHATLISVHNGDNTARANGKTAVEAFENLEMVLQKRNQ